MRPWGVLLLAMGWMGCAHVDPPTDNVAATARNVAKGLPEESRLLMCSIASPRSCQGMPNAGDRDVVRAHVRDNATLSCEIATRDDKAGAPTTAACQCAQSKSNDEFETACASWAGVQ